VQENPKAPKNRRPNWRENGETLEINEIFYSIEGEGQRVGQPTTFIRLSKCNLRCSFCDTEFDSFTEMSIDNIIEEIEQYTATWVCLTGGEPLGQNIVPLAKSLCNLNYNLHIETNGTLDPMPELLDLVDHWTVSPKRKKIASGLSRITELKYIVGMNFNEDHVDENRAQYVYLQPESSDPKYTEKTLEVLKRHPEWRLSYRIHKILNLP
tara:strand:+ start:193 stop:822 length:630 start_codon:yes stop_codon:yes gene_type:complete